MNILAKNLLILASAGSGKTYQLGNRVIGLVGGGVDPERIVALTFTRKAAGEFADSVLTKLAEAAGNPGETARLRAETGIPGLDPEQVLERIVRALPRFTLGTMDGFFGKIVRGFQHELGLTGGTFELLEGPAAEAAKDEILAEILGDPSRPEEGDFFHAFRRAMFGKEGLKVADGLRDFVKQWQGRFLDDRGMEWGPAGLASVDVGDWERRKGELAAKIGRALDGIDFTDGRQRAGIEKFIALLQAHTVGSGLLMTEYNGFRDKVLPALALPGNELRVKYWKELVIGGPAADGLREAVGLLARCEMAAAVGRTRAVREVVEIYDRLCEQRLRRRGRLGFDDVKRLMGEWCRSEDARLRRESVDFRLDARYDHWLLDEFQDTSRADWRGLLPLIDEAAADGEGSMFIVGDRKQAIYAWRGGEVGLFDEVLDRYGNGLERAPMAESWRSCPAVLDLVNCVCGDRGTMTELFGEAAAAWEWDEHVPSPKLAQRRGEARVEVVAGKKGERLERLVELLRELGVGERAMTCGVLLRSNSQVREVAELLRAEGFDVVEEGVRQPARDNPAGIAIWQLLRWLADPSDRFARQTVAMSPLAEVLRQRHGDVWQRVWEALLARAAEAGFAAMVEELVDELWEDWSDFGRRRAGDTIAALAAFDAAGAGTVREAADRLERLEVSQSPGAAAIQVMTIHKSKGLGFDVVLLPEIAPDSIPPAGRFEVAEGDGWISQTPPRWVRDLIPEMGVAERNWETAQRYEAFCTLYVALTRAKRGLYVLLEPPSKSAEADRPSLANWLLTSVGSDGSVGTAFQSGTADWVEDLKPLESVEAMSEPVLGQKVPRRERTTPSGFHRDGETSRRFRATAGSRIGTEVHAVFERVGWIDDSMPDIGTTDADVRVARLLEVPAIRRLLERRGRKIDLFREQQVEALVDGRWLSGVVDRLHVHRADDGGATAVDVVDFKTDAVASKEELAERHVGQMEAYRRVMGKIFSGVPVRCLLVSVKLREVVEF